MHCRGGLALWLVPTPKACHPTPSKWTVIIRVGNTKRLVGLVALPEPVHVLR